MDDIFQLYASLGEEERMIRETVAQFVEKEAEPLMIDAFEQGYFPMSLIKKMADLGLFGLTLPEAYQGSQASYIAYGLACQELERGDSSLRSFVSVQNSLCMYPIYTYGTEMQKQHFLPLMARGELLGAFGLTEPDSGSDPSSMQTVAKKVDQGYVLQGNKMWITNAPIADIAIIWAKCGGSIGAFLVEKSREGLVVNTVKKKMSLRASLTGEIVLDEVFVPEENRLPKAQGLGAALRCLHQARYGIAWGAIGAAMSCFDTTRTYLLERKQFGKPLASFQLIQADLADMYTEIQKALCLHLQLGHLFARQQDTPAMVSLAKRNACRQALFVARTCRNLLGANGISLEYPIIRHMLNLESVFTYEGTDNVHTLVLGRHITGLDAF